MQKKQPAELSKLQSIWDEKLKKSGFNDIEQRDGNLKQWESHFFSRSNVSLFNSKVKYYQLAGQFLHEFEFADKREKIIWELHSEGVSIRNIAKELKRRHFKSYYRFGINLILQKLTKEMLTKYGNSDEE